MCTCILPTTRTTLHVRVRTYVRVTTHDSVQSSHAGLHDSLPLFRLPRHFQFAVSKIREALGTPVIQCSIFGVSPAHHG